MARDGSRGAILQVHLQKRGIATGDIDLNTLAALSEGFTGAELEQAVVAARYRAAAHNGAVTQPSLVEAITETFPLSVTMAEKIEALRHWAAGRTVAA